PIPGRYRVRIVDSGPISGVFTGTVNFSSEKGWPDPGQIGYRATNMKFWSDLKPFATPRLEAVRPQEISGTRGWRSNDSIVLTNKAYPKLASKLRRWVYKGGGNLVLTDEALKMLPAMGIVPGGVESTKVYAGYVNFATRRREVTYADPLARKIDQPGAAEGGAAGAGDIPEDESHRHQTYEPVPIGYSIQTPSGDDLETSPAWFIKAGAFNKAKGRQRAVGTTVAKRNVSLGEIKFGKGRIRFIGSLLPMPSDDFDHPFGLANYGLTYSGYQLLQNALTWTRP
ncbi:MAG: hypothetical protein M3345_04800, partial [Actinomycetota bacterium]|nr:hypothetical protein [Actinomycetota bacterium]